MKITKRQLKRIIKEEKTKVLKDIGTCNPQNEGTKMKITKRQLRRIIKEEKTKSLLEMTGGERARGLLLDDAMAERTKTLMTHLYNNAVNDAIAEEGLMKEEAEEMAVVGVMEVVKEFLNSVGHGYYLE